VKQIADLFRTKQIPCDVIWMDINYMDAFKIFTFDPVKFPDPTSLNNYLHGKNIKSVYMIDPGVKKETGYTIYDQGTAGNHWVKDKNGNEYNGNVWPGACAFPDFTRPETRSWWSGLYSSFMSTGVDGVWNDMNEPSVFDGPDGTMPEDNIHRGGGGLAPDVHTRYHNVYGMLMVKASRDGILNANPSKRPFVLSRSNFLGGQRYGATWSGDNVSTMDMLKMSIPMSINLGLSGQPFNGADIGGFSDNCTADLFSHWISIGVYYPFCRTHSSYDKVDQEPWAFGAQTEAVSRTAINRRYRLLPYFYTLFKEAATTGMPIMRPQYFADLTDLNLRTEQQSFLLGSDLMIVPRWADKVKVPNANWNKVNFETTDDGYQPLVLIRPGAIVPLGQAIQSTVDYKTDSITLLLNPTVDGAASGTLYHDAGDGFGYQTGDYVIHQFTSSKYHADSLRIDISKTEGNKTVNRLYRIGYVTDEGIVYNNWSAATTQYVKIIEDTHPTIDLSLLNKVYVGGTFTNWAANLMTQSTTNKRLWTTTLIIPAGAQELKFSYQSDWTGNSWGNATGLTGIAKVIPAGNTGIIFSSETVGKYNLNFNDSSLVYSIQYISPLAALPWDGTIATSYAGGTGTSGNPYQISTPAELAFLSQSVNGGTQYFNNYFILTSDLDLNSQAWTPIGSTGTFRGTFDGKSHVISNLNVNLPTTTSVGLFGTVQYAKIKNVGIVGTSTVTGAGNVGGIVGQVTGAGATACNISGCFSNASVSSGSGSNAGGIVGYFYNTTGTTASSSITNCYSTGNISGVMTSGTNYVSGIVGRANGVAALLTISNSYATGTITATGGATNFAYGIAKITVSGTGTITVTNCFHISGTTQTGATAKTVADMQAAAFVTSLNASQSPAPWIADWTGGNSVNNGYPIIKPFISMIPATVTAFTTTYGTASAAQTFSVSGSYLGANIVAYAPTGFEVSNDGTSYSTTATFPKSGTTNSASGTLFIHLKATATVSGTYTTQNIVIASSGATSAYITPATGTAVTAKALTITAGNQTVAYGTDPTTVTGAGTYTPTGFIPGEDATVISGTATYSTTYTNTTAVGTLGVTITPNVTGLTAANYSFVPVDGTITIKGTTGLNTTEKLNAQVFANASNQITIIAPASCKFSIYNAVGQLIENGTLNTKRETLNTKLTAGMYMVKLSGNGNDLTTRVIIK
jgi:hypothetical protein